MLEIHDAGSESAAELSALCARSFAEAYRGMIGERDIAAYCEKHYSRAAIEAALADPDVIYTLAYRDGEAVGFARIQPRACPEIPDPGGIELKQIYLLASEFGQGTGKRLLGAVFHRARKLNFNLIWLSVADSNSRARSFYRKNGFEALAAAPKLEVGSERLPATLMSIRLDI